LDYHPTLDNMEVSHAAALLPHTCSRCRAHRHTAVGPTDRQTDRQRDRETERQRDMQTDRQTDRQSDSQTDRRAD
jgi:hypothetical protein